MGVGSRRMRTLFEAAKKKAPCIVFIDEIDAIGGNRKQWENHSRSVLNQMLIEMDGFETNENVIVMAATNIEVMSPGWQRHITSINPRDAGGLHLSHCIIPRLLVSCATRRYRSQNSP